MGRRRSLSTALPAPFAPCGLSRVGRFPAVTGPALCRLPFHARVTRNPTQKRNRQCRIQNGRTSTPASPTKSSPPWNRASAPGSNRGAARTRRGRITRPLRHNGMPYSGINILMLWASAIEQGFASPSWMTFKQALELNAHVRKGEKGSLVVYANSVTKTEQNDARRGCRARYPLPEGLHGVQRRADRGLPEHYYVKPEAEVHAGRAHRARRGILRAHPRRHPLPRRPGLLRAGARLHPDAADRGVPRRRKLLRHARA